PSRSAEHAPEPGKPGDAGYKRSPAPADPDFGAVPPSTSSPRLPKFHKFSDADRDRILNARRLARRDEPAPAATATGLADVRRSFKPAAEPAAPVETTLDESTA